MLSQDFCLESSVAQLIRIQWTDAHLVFKKPLKFEPGVGVTPLKMQETLSPPH